MSLKFFLKYNNQSNDTCSLTPPSRYYTPLTLVKHSRSPHPELSENRVFRKFTFQQVLFYFLLRLCNLTSFNRVVKLSFILQTLVIGL